MGERPTHQESRKDSFDMCLNRKCRFTMRQARLRAHSLGVRYMWGPTFWESGWR